MDNQTERRTNDHVITQEGNEWIYEVPPRTDAKVQLLTIGAVQTTGNWYGKFGEFFVAYAPIPKRNKQRERELGVLQSGLLYPSIRTAAHKIFYDNGMVNRTASETALLDESFERLHHKFTVKQLEAAEAELAALDNAALELLCCGAVDDPAMPKISATTDRLLNLIFENSDES